MGGFANYSKMWIWMRNECDQMSWLREGFMRERVPVGSTGDWCKPAMNLELFHMITSSIGAILADSSRKVMTRSRGDKAQARLSWNYLNFLLRLIKIELYFHMVFVFVPDYGHWRWCLAKRNNELIIISSSFHILAIRYLSSVGVKCFRTLNLWSKCVERIYLTCWCWNEREKRKSKN